MLKIIEIPIEKNLRYFCLVFAITFAFKLITALIATYFDPSLTDNPVVTESLVGNFILMVIIAPLIETLIYQFAIIEIGFRLKFHPLLSIIISALAFGLSHHYNIVYVLITTVSGFIYAYYYTALRPQNYTNRFVLVALLHSLFNLIAFLNNYIFKFF